MTVVATMSPSTNSPSTNSPSGRFSLVVASLHHPTYGFDAEHSSKDICSHILCIHKSPNTAPKHLKCITQTSKLVRKQMDILRKKNGGDNGPIHNFFNIMEKMSHPQIGETNMLPGNEMVVVLKTIWIRLIQRTWKKVYTQRLTMLQERCKPQSIAEHERSGIWPSTCNVMPGIRGMLNGL